MYVLAKVFNISMSNLKNNECMNRMKMTNIHTSIKQAALFIKKVFALHFAREKVNLVSLGCFKIYTKVLQLHHGKILRIKYFPKLATIKALYL